MQAYAWMKREMFGNLIFPREFSLCSVQKQHKKDSYSLGKSKIPRYFAFSSLTYAYSRYINSYYPPLRPLRGKFAPF